MIRAALSVMSLAIFAATATSCATDEAAEAPPAWFEQRRTELDAQGTPSLVNIPRGTDANTNAAHWARVEQNMKAAEAAIHTPRSEPPAAATITDPAFEAQAREELEATRNNY